MRTDATVLIPDIKDYLQRQCNVFDFVANRFNMIILPNRNQMHGYK